MEMVEYKRKLDELFEAYEDTGFTIMARMPSPEDEVVKQGIFEIHGRPSKVRKGVVAKMAGTYEQHISSINEFRGHMAAGDELNWPTKE